MIELKYDRTYTDCTVGYNVILDRDYSIIEFVDEVLKREEFKNGTIEILSQEYNPSQFYLSECFTITYEGSDIKCGSIESEALLDNEVLNNLMNQRVVLASALDGWNGNYSFKIRV